MQEEIAHEISEKLRLQLTGEEKKRLTKPVTRNKEAYQLYLKATYFAHKWSLENLNKAIEYSRQAIEHDPALAEAHAIMALSYNMLGNFGGLPPGEAFHKAKAAALRALALDEALSLAHAASAGTLLFYDWDWRGAEEECRRALELNPDDPVAHQTHAACLAVKGDSEGAVAEQKRAVELDPLSPALAFIMGFWLFLARRCDQAIEQLRKALELDPNIVLARVVLASSYALNGMYEEAMAECETMKRFPMGDLLSRSALAHVYAMTGRGNDARGILDGLRQLPGGMLPHALLRVAAAYTALNERDQAFQLLDKACDRRLPMMIYLKVYPYFDNLHSDPRFQELLRRMGLPN